MSENTTTPEALAAQATDGFTLRGFVWRHREASRERPVVIINAATSVRCRYYSRFAAYLFRHGFDVVTHDYRGIGESRPATLRGFEASWVSWGRLDFEAVLRYVERSFRGQPIYVVAHSIGGFLFGFAPSNHLVQRVFTMGAQIAYWRDHPREQRAKLFLKWHIVMPLLTALLGYFPGKKLGWLEDTPKGVVRDWRRFGSRAMKDAERYALLEPFAGVTAPTLAVSVTDDEFGTIPAIERTLSCFPNSPATHLRISPESIGRPDIGHFAFFHDRFEQPLWQIPLEWLQHGRLPKAAPGVIVASRERTALPVASPIAAAEGDG
ncbi:MAG: alpha/beta fold hydrolase [Sulfurifustaceae bacterium]